MKKQVVKIQKLWSVLAHLKSVVNNHFGVMTATEKLKLFDLLAATRDVTLNSLKKRKVKAITRLGRPPHNKKYKGGVKK